MPTQVLAVFTVGWILVERPVLLLDRLLERGDGFQVLAGLSQGFAEHRQGVAQEVPIGQVLRVVTDEVAVQFARPLEVETASASRPVFWRTIPRLKRVQATPYLYEAMVG